MSHFPVGVITKGKPTENQIVALLAPFQENNMGDCPKEYLQFFDIEEQERNHYETGADRQGNKFKTTYATFEEYMKDWHGHDKRDAEKGVYGYWANPNAKWDWYEIGGRWSGSLRVPADTESAKAKIRGNRKEREPHYISEEPNIVLVDGARIKDIVFTNEERYKRALRFWELVVEEQEAITKEDKDLTFSLYKPSYYLEKYKTKEEFAKLDSAFSTYAVLKNGQWHEPGKMGWFGCSHAKVEEELAFEQGYKDLITEGAEEDDWITVVDCHT